MERLWRGLLQIYFEASESRSSINTDESVIRRRSKTPYPSVDPLLKNPGDPYVAITVALKSCSIKYSNLLLEIASRGRPTFPEYFIKGIGKINQGLRMSCNVLTCKIASLIWRRTESSKYLYTNHSTQMTAVQRYKRNLSPSCSVVWFEVFLFRRAPVKISGLSKVSQKPINKNLCSNPF